MGGSKKFKKKKMGEKVKKNLKKKHGGEGTVKNIQTKKEEKQNH